MSSLVARKFLVGKVWKIIFEVDKPRKDMFLANYAKKSSKFCVDQREDKTDTKA